MMRVLVTLIVVTVLLVISVDYTRTIYGSTRRVCAIFGVFLGLLSLLLAGGFR